MPFTLAHPAAILPLRHVRVLRSVPLIIGALIPDLPYYLPGGLSRYGTETHSVRGSLSSCLLAGYLVLALIYFLRLPLTALLSARARWLCLTAIAPYSRPLEWALAPLSIVAGIWTHLLWDSFTHSHGWVVRRVAALSAPVVIGTYNGQMYHVLQYVSSAFGLAVMAVWYWRLRVPRAAPPPPGAPRSSVGPVLMLVTAAAILIGGVQAMEFFSHSHAIYRTLNILLTRSLAWFAGLYLLAGSLVTLQHQHEAAAG
jgi:Domain of unknown function (DUF4184)